MKLLIKVNAPDQHAIYALVECMQKKRDDLSVNPRKNAGDIRRLAQVWQSILPWDGYSAFCPESLLLSATHTDVDGYSGLDVDARAEAGRDMVKVAELITSLASPYITAEVR